MTAFPIFTRLSVNGYGMYPGTKARPGLDITFVDGLTLVLGANGLGKTTLVTMLYRMCTGPVDISGLAAGQDLGSRKLVPSSLKGGQRRLFADRVVDGASEATATLEMRLGETNVSVKRGLASLQLLEFEIDGEALTGGENEYQQCVTACAGLASFSDWLLLLRYLVFYFEDRRALVWDPSAQRQILRLLFLPADLSAEWTERERDILKKDSRMRNLQNVVRREEVELAQAEIEDPDAAREELKSLQKLQEADDERRAQLSDDIAVLESDRQVMRLRAVKAAMSHESAYRDIERLQLLTIRSAFPSREDTATYLFAKLFGDETCLTCGAVAPGAADGMKTRLAADECVVCGSALPHEVDTPSVPKRKLASARTTLDRSEAEHAVAAAARDEADRAFAAAVTELNELDARIAQHSMRIDALVRELPPDEHELHEKRGDIARLRADIEVMKRDLVAERRRFRRFIDKVNHKIVTQKSYVQNAFAEFAEGFLLESCALAWAPHKDKVGEYGAQIEFPAFELEMTAASFSSPVRRTGPQQVSESQREFIDLSFRMALMKVSGADGAGSLVIDAPESSLDAVFVTRAADVLARFARAGGGNRLVITSNLVEGDLIPELMRKAGIRSGRDKRIVDLLKLAAPTMATRKLAADYVAVRRALYARASR